MHGRRLFPEDMFVNQDADPFVFYQYARWNAAVIADDMKLTNTIGGFNTARYDKVG